MFCENCGQPMNGGEQFCPNCGAMVSGADPVPNTYVQPHPEENAKKPLLIVLLIVGILSLLAIIGLAVFFMSDAHKINKQLGLAEKYLDDSDYEEAINALTEALELDEDNSDVKSKLKKAYKEAIKQAIEEDDEHHATKLIEEANDLLDTSYFDKFFDMFTAKPAPVEEAAPAAEAEYPEEAATAEKTTGIIEEAPSMEADDELAAIIAEHSEYTDYKLPSERNMRNILDKMTDWIALQYFYENHDYVNDDISNRVRFELAAWSAYHDNFDSLEYDSSGCVKVPKEMLLQYENDLLGTEIDSSTISQETNHMVTPQKDGSALLSPGDWGTLTPCYDINDVMLIDTDMFDIFTHYYAYDWESGQKTYDPEWYVVYRCRLTGDESFTIMKIFTNH